MVPQTEARQRLLTTLFVLTLLVVWLAARACAGLATQIGAPGPI